MKSPSPAPVFGLGRLFIDFVFTGGAGDRARWETWHEPADVDAWFARSTLAPIEVSFDVRTFAAARQLREALWLVARGLARGESIPTDAVDVVNRAARATPLVPFYDARTGRALWHAPTASQCLSSVARDAISLIGDARQRSRVRECQNPDCAIIFYDDSRPGVRRWCRPERCGDRIRARTYRQRRGEGRNAADGQSGATATGAPARGEPSRSAALPPRNRTS